MFGMKHSSLHLYTHLYMFNIYNAEYMYWCVLSREAYCDPNFDRASFSDVSSCAICALCGGKSGWGCVSWPPPGAICEMGVQDWAMPALQT